ncbi:MAG: class I SAM-dependent methyltransferase [Solirubrobacterales bacterium]|nr:class I SAM-dependent methyltransferase [Solirubrobacterales bacterium]
MSEPVLGTSVTPGPVASAGIIWHDLECGSYTADLPLWRTLAAVRDSPILELGAGTGRVTLDLARRGHRVVALDRDPELLRELERRAEGLAVEVVVADARSFSLRHSFSLCLVPMQAIQLLGGVAGRAAMLSCVARHLRPGGLIAIALTTELELWCLGDGGAAPLPDACERDGTAFFSQPIAIVREPDGYVLERRREAIAADGRRTIELDRVTLDHLDAAELEREGVASGLRPAGRSTIAATPDYAGSEVVMLGA